MIPKAMAEDRVSTRFPWSRLNAYYKRNAARLVFRRPLAIRTQVPLISFTFDDFPRSALVAGGAILNRYGLSGTYYASLGLLGKDSPSGPICVPGDLRELRERGHELGCHTFSHCHSWDTEKSAFETSLIQNRAALSELLPGAEFTSFSYPISEPRPLTKRRVAEYFLSCRAGGQRFNTGTVDLNLLAAYFLEKSRDRVQAVKNLIDDNRAVRGWLIFATHDVSESPSRFGCTPGFFEDIVQYAASSGARILPVVNALEVLGAPRAGNGR
jgi:peptidoglycan/xylan/chitin deacetylase (PgdA/CDA1 family)